MDQAIEMHTEVGNFDRAIQLSKTYDKKFLLEIYERMGSIALQQGDF